MQMFEARLAHSALAGFEQDLGAGLGQLGMLVASLGARHKALAEFIHGPVRGLDGL